AAPISVSDWATASIGVVQLGVKVASEAVPAAVMAAAAEAAARLSGSPWASGTDGAIGTLARAPGRSSSGAGPADR
ncbi:MAG TPA: hypothetical protein VF070_04940, partial [Streptosporangiaceae bacterium]